MICIRVEVPGTWVYAGFDFIGLNGLDSLMGSTSDGLPCFVQVGSMFTGAIWLGVVNDMAYVGNAQLGFKPGDDSAGHIWMYRKRFNSGKDGSLRRDHLMASGYGAQTQGYVLQDGWKDGFVKVKKLAF